MAERICILLRHGEYEQLSDTPSAHQPFGLTAKGTEQARSAIGLIQALLVQNGWSLHSEIHTSSLLRAYQTAATVMEGLDTETSLVETDRLTERCVGNAANLRRAQIERVVEQDPRFESLPANWKSDSHFRLPFVGAESLLESGERVAEYLRGAMGVVNSHRNAVLFFGHGASMRHAAYHLGVLKLTEVSALSMHHAQPIALSVSDNGNWRHVAGQWKQRSVRSEPMD